MFGMVVSKRGREWYRLSVTGYWLSRELSQKCGELGHESNHAVQGRARKFWVEYPGPSYYRRLLDTEDQPYENLLIWMPHTCCFIDEVLRTGGVVLVHGVHGLSRGATIMAAYCKIPVPPCLILQYPDSLTTCCTSNVVSARQCSYGYRHGYTKYAKFLVYFRQTYVS